MTTDTKAENALWRALEERRENLRAQKLWTGRTEQQHRKLEAAYDDGPTPERTAAFIAHHAAGQPAVAA